MHSNTSGIAPQNLSLRQISESWNSASAKADEFFYRGNELFQVVDDCQRQPARFNAGTVDAEPDLATAAQRLESLIDESGVTQ